MNVLIIGCSLNPRSTSQLLAREAEGALRSLGVEPERVDLRDWEMPLCGGGETLDPSHIARIEAADAVVMAVPIYNYAVSAAAKNLVELTGDAWREKVVGFLCAAGGQTSYMGVMGLANSLMLDFRCVIVPRFVYTTWHDFEEDRLSNEGVRRRLEQFAAETVRIGGALRRGE